jgi:mercuric ion transport protein
MSSTKEIPGTVADRSWRRGLYLLTAALTCPCHLPIYLLILGGTSVGAALQDNAALAFLGLTVIFILALGRGLRRPLGDGSRDKDVALPRAGGRDPTD